MKNAFSIVIATAISSMCIGQSSDSHSILIVSCKTGELFIDGNSVGQIEADDASRHTLSIGEHYLQVKSTSDKTSMTVDSCDVDPLFLHVDPPAKQAVRVRT